MVELPRTCKPVTEITEGLGAQGATLWLLTQPPPLGTPSPSLARQKKMPSEGSSVDAPGAYADIPSFSQSPTMGGKVLLLTHGLARRHEQKQCDGSR